MTQTVRIDQFRGFIDDQRTRIQSAFREIEQLQVEFQGHYTRFRVEHDQTLRALAERLSTQSDGIGAKMQAQIDARVPEERATITQRIANLEREIPKAQTQADNVIARAQKEIADLRAINPKLNEREEELKTQWTRGQQSLDALNAKISALGKGLGFIFNAWQIQNLDRERAQTLGRLETLDAQLRKVRQEWHELSAMVTKNEADWQAQWQKATADTARLRQERDYLVQNTDAEARRRAVTFVLDNLKTLPPDADAGLFKPMIDLNIQTDDFQSALGSVAGILGVLRGIDEGLKRIGESVNAIIAELNRHGAYLRPPSVVIPDNALQFNLVWDEIASKTRDEKKVAQHPADFVAVMKPILTGKLAEQQITGLFSTLGGALTAATRGWKG